MAVWDASGEPVEGWYEVRWRRQGWADVKQARVEDVTDMLELVGRIHAPAVGGDDVGQVVFLETRLVVAAQVMRAKLPDDLPSPALALLRGAADVMTAGVVKDVLAVSGLPERTFWYWRKRLIEGGLIGGERGFLFLTEAGEEELMSPADMD